MVVATLHLSVYLTQAGMTGENKHKGIERSSRKTNHSSAGGLGETLGC